MPLDPELLSILVCPACKGQLEWDEPALRLKCHRCHLAYPVEDDIPIMLIDRAEPTPAPDRT